MYEVGVTELYGGHSQAILDQPEPLHEYDVGYGIREEADLELVRDYFHVIKGMFHWFRFKDWNDYRSGNRSADVTAFDQVLGIADGVTLTYQAKKTYDIGAGITTERTIYKIVAGTAKLGVQNSEIPSSRFTINNNTGLYTLAANVQRSITNITQAAQAQVTTSTGHTLAVGDSVHFSGVSGMTQINGLRGNVVSVQSSTVFTVNITTLAFSAYTSGGVINTNPQAGEGNVKGGFEFDVPVRCTVKALPTSWIAWEAGEQELTLKEVRVEEIL